MQVDNNIVEQIKERIDIAELILQYVPTLKRAGRVYKACCPFHKEKTPSFTCSSEKGLFYCFGCQEGGDIFAFVMKMENIPFNEALKKLAQMAGVEYAPTRPLTHLEKQRADLRHVADYAKNFFHTELMAPTQQAATIREYVKSRNLTKETCQKFQLGWAKGDGNSFTRQAQKQGYSANIIQEAGLGVDTSYGLRDYFRNRLMFPIFNPQGDTIGFGGRILGDGEPKYLNSPETLLFSKSHVLYGLNFASSAIRKNDCAILLEGYMDVIGCHQAGIEYAVAPLGTSFTPEHARLLKRYTSNVIVLFDPDAAGIKAAQKASITLIESGCFAKIASLPEGLDPDEYIAKYGKESFEAILKNAQDFIAFHTEQNILKHPQPLSAQSKTQIISDLVEIINKQPDKIVQREWAKYVAEHIGVEEQLVLERFQKSIRLIKPMHTTQKDKQPTVATFLTKTEEQLFSILLQHKEYVALCEELTSQHFSSSLAWEVLVSLRKAVNEEDILTSVTNQLPQAKNELVKLTLAILPTENDLQRDVEACIEKIQQLALQNRLKKLKQQMKQLGAGNVPAELFQEYMQLQNRLKK